MNVTVFGGTGFLGRHVCECLSRRGISATAISRAPDVDFLKRHAPTVTGLKLGSEEANDALRATDTLLHFAHVSRPGSAPHAEQSEIEKNIAPLVDLLHLVASDRPGVRVVYMSTGGQIYGPGHRKPIPETAPPSPTTPYALGKHLIEQTLDYYGRVGRIRPLVLRLANPVGRWQLESGHGFVSAAVTRTLRGEPITIFGPGRNARDYFDADDFASFLVDVAQNPELPDGVFNIGTGIGLTEYDVLQRVEAELKAAPVISHAPARSFDLDYAVLNAERAASLLGWAPTTALETTILRLKEELTRKSADGDP